MEQSLYIIILNELHKHSTINKIRNIHITSNFKKSYQYKIFDVNSCLFILYFFIPPQRLTNIHNPTNDQKPLTQPLENVDIVFSRLLPVVWR